MAFYKKYRTARPFLKASHSYDGRHLIEWLKDHLPARAEVLELGMGAGHDLDILSETFKATGSDYSRYFLEQYAKTNAHADLLMLDAKTISTPRRFDALYSNKVLHHLKPADLKKSIKRQHACLKANGLILHSFWKGKKMDRQNGLIFKQWETSDLDRLFRPYFTKLELRVYTEMSPDDSIAVLGYRR